LLKSLRFRALWLLIALMAAAIPDWAQLRFNVVNREIVEQRLKSYKGNDNQREATLKGFFETAGCTADKLTEQPVVGLKQPNIICELPGKTDSVIVVGAHYDHVADGDGVVDNWSGASMLPSLYQALKNQDRQNTYLFIAFSGEEKGLVGSAFYVKTLAPEQMKKIKAMICMDTLALGPTEVWVSHSDADLVRELARMATALKAPLTRMDVEKVGKSDEESFRQYKVPTITLHSLTQKTLNVLHNPRDNYSAVHFDDYYQSYRLISGYLALLDQNMLPAATAATPGADGTDKLDHR
jgi:hypothetical protein